MSSKMYDFGDDDSSSEETEEELEEQDMHGSIKENDEGWSDGSGSTYESDDNDEQEQRANDRRGYAPRRPSMIEEEEEYEEESASAEEVEEYSASEETYEEENEEDEVLEFEAKPMEDYSIMNTISGSKNKDKYEDSFQALVEKENVPQRKDFNASYMSYEEVLVSSSGEEESYEEETDEDSDEEEEDEDEEEADDDEESYETEEEEEEEEEEDTSEYEDDDDGEYEQDDEEGESSSYDPDEYPNEKQREPPEPASSFHTSPEVYEAPDTIYEEGSTEVSDDRDSRGGGGDYLNESFVVQPAGNNLNHSEEDLVELSTDESEDDDEDTEMNTFFDEASSINSGVKSPTGRAGRAAGLPERYEDEPEPTSESGNFPEVFPPEENKKEKKGWGGFFGFGRKSDDEDDDDKENNKTEQPKRGGFMGLNSNRKLNEKKNRDVEDSEGETRPLFTGAPPVSEEGESSRPDSLQDVSYALGAETTKKRGDDSTRSSSRGGDSRTSSMSGGKKKKKKKRSSSKKKSSKEEKGGDAPMIVGGVSEEFEDEPDKSNRRSGLFASFFGGKDEDSTTEREEERKQKKRRRMAQKASQRPEQPKSKDGDYDEEMAMYRSPERVDKQRARRRNRQLVLICLCLAVIIIGASFGTAYYGTKLALEKNDDDDDDNNTNTTERGGVGALAATSAPTEPSPTSSPTASASPTSPTSAPSPAPTMDRIFNANNTIGCPAGNVPLELIIVFDSKPAEVGILLRDSGRSPIWNFVTGTFKSFTQFQRENYFMVCVSPGLTYELEITDSSGDGLVSQFVQQPIYGRFGVFYENQAVGTYDGDCGAGNAATDCGSFCSCKFSLGGGAASGSCTTTCDSFVT